jgi:uncharacterized membrane-anchored protein
MELNHKKETLQSQALTEQTRQMLNKVPEVTIFFWIIKVLCTTVGETFSDFLNLSLGLGLTLTTVLVGIVFFIVVVFQFRATKYNPGIYWLTVVLLSVFGTLITDNLTDNLGVPLEISTAVFTVLLLLTFLFWYLSEKTLSIHSIFTTRREAFYWLTILFTFALGTAVGDLFSEQLGLGYLNTGILVAVIITAVFLAWKFIKIDGILTFWIAYIFTRPLGASLGDFLSQPVQYGGLGLGATSTSIIFLAAILGIILLLSVSKLDTIPKNTAAPAKQRTDKTKSVLLQTVVVVFIFLAGGISSFFWLSGDVSNQANATQTTLSGQLTNFITIETFMMDSINANNPNAAKTSADDLENVWDSSSAQLKKIDKATWNEIDGTIDNVLSGVRSKNPDANKCKTALQASLEALNKANK